MNTENQRWNLHTTVVLFYRYAFVLYYISTIYIYIKSAETVETRTNAITTETALTARDVHCDIEYRKRKLCLMKIKS